MLMIVFFMLFFLMSIQPMLLIISLILITLIYSLVIWSFMGSYWFSYALVLVMLSGVLVVFTYMVSLIPNESFEIYNLIFIMMFMMFMIENKYFGFMLDLSMFSMNLWISYIGMFNLFLVSFLLVVMVMVVWLSLSKQGAVRVL